MPFSVTKEFTFSAAHALTKYHGACERLHGHNYRLRVTVVGELNEDDLVIDFLELKKIVQAQVIDQLDHTNLNDRFPNPTCELIAQWIYHALRSLIPITEVTLWETDTSLVTYHE